MDAGQSGRNANDGDPWSGRSSGLRPPARRAESDHVSRMSSALAFGRSREPIEDTICYTRLPSLPSPRVRVSVSVQTDLRFPTSGQLATGPGYPTPTSTARVPCAGRRRPHETNCAGTTARARRATVPAQRSQPVGHAPWWSLRHLIIDRSAGSTEHACMFFVRLSRLLESIHTFTSARRRRTGLLFHRSSMFRHAPFRPFDFRWVFFSISMADSRQRQTLVAALERPVSHGWRQARGSSDPFRPPLKLKENVLSVRLSRPASSRISSSPRDKQLDVFVSPLRARTSSVAAARSPHRRSHAIHVCVHAAALSPCPTSFASSLVVGFETVTLPEKKKTRASSPMDGGAVSQGFLFKPWVVLLSPDVLT